MKIGIMGGTFDPVHNGHLMLGEYAYRIYGLDEIWFMPNGKPPHKGHSIESAVEQRVEMVRRAIKTVPYFKLSLYEAQKGETCYSCDTIQELSCIYPEHEFYFIIGADSLFTIETWYHPERLLKQCTILAAFRDDKGRKEMQEQIAYLNRKYQAKIKLLVTPVLDISSHDIRERVRAGRSLDGLVPQEIEAYMKAQHLFEEEIQ